MLRAIVHYEILYNLVLAHEKRQLSEIYLRHLIFLCNFRNLLEQLLLLGGLRFRHRLHALLKLT